MKAKEYQSKVAGFLSGIFGSGQVKQEWDSAQYDGHSFNHTSLYAPRIDIAVGPFNSLMDLDIGNDNTEPFKAHFFTTNLLESTLENRGSMAEIWNKDPLCYLAIEIEFSGSAKHILGSIVNACVSGSLGIIIASKENKEKVNRAYKYLMRLDGKERININYLRNLTVFEEGEFLDFILEINKLI